MIIATELGQPLRITSGPAIQHAGDLAALLSSLVPGEVLFLDEIHRMARPAEEMLYMAMEDFRVDVVVGKGPGRDRDPAGAPAVHPRRGHDARGAAARAAARPVRLHRPPGLLRRGRAGARSCGAPRSCSTSPLRDDAAPRSRGARGARRASPTGCCAGSATTPRSRPTGVLDRGTSRGRAGGLRGRRDRAWTGWTRPCSTRCCAGSVAARSASATLAVAVGEERETVEEVAEPFLVRSGLLARTPRGRIATPAAWEHLGLTPPAAGPAGPHCSTLGADLLASDPGSDAT